MHIVLYSVSIALSEFKSNWCNDFSFQDHKSVIMKCVSRINNKINNDHRLMCDSLRNRTSLLSYGPIVIIIIIIPIYSCFNHGPILFPRITNFPQLIGIELTLKSASEPAIGNLTYSRVGLERNSDSLLIRRDRVGKRESRIDGALLFWCAGTRWRHLVYTVPWRRVRGRCGRGYPDSSARGKGMQQASFINLVLSIGWFPRIKPSWHLVHK